MTVRTWFAMCWVSLWLSWPCFAEPMGSPLVTTFRPQEYKGHQQVWSCVEDDRGVMLFGTSEGVTSYDGHRWTRVPMPNHDAIVGSLAKGNDGIIYYGSPGDFGYLRVEPGGKLQGVSLIKDVQEKFQFFDDVWQLVPMSRAVYVITRERIFKIWNFKVEAIPGLISSAQACVLNDTLFYSDKKLGVCAIQDGSPMPLNFEGVKDLRKACFVPFSTHQILVTRVGEPGQIFDISSFWDPILKSYAFSKDPIKGQVFESDINPILKGEKASWIYRLLPIDANRFAICTLKQGLVFIDRSGKVTQRLAVKSGLADDTVFDCYLDRFKNLWVLTNYGISHVALSGHVSTLGDHNGLQGPALNAFKDGDRVFFGSFEGLQWLDKYDPINDACRPLKTVEGAPSEVWDFLRWDDQLLLVSATQGLGVFKGDRVISCGPRFSANALIRSRKHADILYVGGYGVMAIFRKVPASAQYPMGLKHLGYFPGIKGKACNMAQDAQGDVWIATEAHGILRVRLDAQDPGRGEVDFFGLQQGLPGLLSMRVFAFGKGVYVVSPKGILGLELPKNGPLDKSAVYFKPQGGFGEPLKGQDVQARSIVASDERTLWVTSQRGIYQALLGSDGQWRFDDMPFKGIPVPDEKFFVTSDHQIILPGKPIYIVDFNAERTFQSSFETLVTRVLGDGKAVFEGVFEPDRPNREDRPERFQPDQSSILFEYAAPFFEHASKNEFQYVLEGVEKDWSAWSLEIRKEYTFLSPGTYCFKVRARNIYGTIGKEARFYIQVLPVWYRTWWAMLVWTLLGGLLIWGCVFLYNLRLRRQTIMLEGLVKARTESLNLAKEKAEQASAFKSSFIANTSHELRTPLNAILGFMRLLVAVKVQEGDRIRFSRIVLNASENLLQIVNDLLDLSKIEAGHLTLQREPFDLRDVLENALCMLGQRAQEKHLLLTAMVAPEVPVRLMGDAHRLEQMLINLIGNAITFTHKGFVRVNVAGEKDGSMWRIRVAVEDSGPGILSERLSELFTAFTQMESGARENGTGLGLSITRQLAERMGGDVGVESTLGKGSCFWFRFMAPEVEGEFKYVAVREHGLLNGSENLSKVLDVKGMALPEKVALGPGRVLVAEDNPSNRLLMEALLAQLGVECLLVEDGLEAVRAFENALFQVVILDDRMPGLDGQPCLLELRQRPKGQDVGIVLCAADSASKTGYRERGFDAVLDKPVALRQLYDVLKTYLPAPPSDLSALDPVEPAAVDAVDGKRLEDLAGLLGGNDGLYEFLDAYLADASQRLNRIEDCVQRLDRAGISRELHDLKANAGNAGLNVLLQLLIEMEEAVPEMPVEHLKERLEAVREGVRRSSKALQAWMDQRKAQQVR